MPDPGDAPGSPLVVACVRHGDLRPDVDPLTGAVTLDAHRAGLSAADEAAVEHALRVAEAWSATVLVVTAGPAAADHGLRDAVALGGEALRVPWPPPEGGRPGPAEGYVDELGADERALARAVAAALPAPGPPALVVCGDRSADRGTGAFPAFLAHELGAAQALGLVELHPEGDRIVAERRLDGGRRERLGVPRPAVCSVEGAGVRLRRAALPAVLAAARAAIPVAPPECAGSPVRLPAVSVGGALPYRPRTRPVPPPDSAAPRQRLLSLTGVLAANEPPTVIGPVDAAEAADELLAFLARHGYLGHGDALGHEDAPAGTKP